MKLSYLSQQGFTLIEVIVFIVVSSILMNVILLSANTALRNAPSVHNQWVAVQSARGCMEWFLQQRRLQGYDTLSCPSTPSASACSIPSGFTVSTSVSCTTWNSDTSFKTLVVTIGGRASASLSVQLGEY